MRPRLLILLAIVCAAALVSAAAAYAAFTSGASVAQSISTNTLQPPTTVVGTVAPNCKSVTVTWVGSTSTFATGYTIQRNGTTVGTVSAATASYTDSTTSRHTQYTYTVLATFQQWSSGAAAPAVTTC
jgi:curli biogenesis system outer membrane secretion channel CsgG